MRRILVWSLSALAGVTLLLALAAGAGYVWLRGSLPRLEGTLQIAGLQAPVEVLRDPDGIVTIRARSERDAVMALGFVHAQDRLWQMDFMRRGGAGRLAEVLGARALRLDRFMRTLGLYRVAEANVAHLSHPVRDVFEAYAAGINAFIADPGGPLPLEFQLLGYRPAPWRPADSLVWGRVMALQLSGNWADEILRARIARRLTPEQAGFLWPDYPKDGPVALKDLARWLRGLPLERFAGLLPWELAPKDASNSWVVAGARTASGAPILANDPHLALTAPGAWYLARIETPALTLSGATAPGLPLMVVGHNGQIAWGFTTTHSDTQDLFVERLAEDDPTQYLTPDGPRPFETREEVIAVRGEAPQRWSVRATRHGPVISDAVAEDADELSEAGTVLALAWPALRPDDRSGEALYGINHARTWDEFRAALRDFHSPHQNIVYADRAGTIGFAAPARVPIRKRGDGRTPVPGWSGEYDWTGEIPFADLPMAVNPPDGRIVAANNKIVPDGYRYLLTANWRDPYRARRIQELLDSDRDPGRTPEGSLAIQQDIASLAARDLLPLLLRAEPTTERGREATAILAEWDGRMDRDSPAPLLFHAWIRAFNRMVLADELGPDFAQFQRPKAELLTRILSDGQIWCDDVGTEAREGCAERLVDALEVALSDLAIRYPRPVGRLRWGEAHVARFAHPLLARMPVLGPIFGTAVETDGGSYTVNRGAVSFSDRSAYPFENVHGPGYRAVYDLADLDDSRFMIAFGQSGNPLSPFYGSLIGRWRDGDYVKLVGDATVPVKRLLLTPEQAEVSR
ncbi:MAG: penicillin acylase family protein [Kiloniellaceae bacterium]